MLTIDKLSKSISFPLGITKFYDFGFSIAIRFTINWWILSRWNFTASTMLDTLFQQIVIVFIVLLYVVRLKSRVKSDTRSNCSVHIDFNEMMVTHLPIFICVVCSSEIKTDVVDDDNVNRWDASKYQQSAISRARTNTSFKVLYLVQVFPFGEEINDALERIYLLSCSALIYGDAYALMIDGGRCELIRNVLIAICLYAIRQCFTNDRDFYYSNTIDAKLRYKNKEIKILKHHISLALALSRSYAVWRLFPFVLLFLFYLSLARTRSTHTHTSN